MRGLIIDDLRRRQSQRRGGLFEISSLGTDDPDNVSESQALEEIGDALEELAKVEPDLAEIVDLKFFCGFSSLTSQSCAALRNGPFSVAGRRPASICIMRSRTRSHPIRHHAATQR